MELRVVHASNKFDTLVHEELHRHIREEDKAHPNGARAEETLLWVGSFIGLIISYLQTIIVDFKYNLLWVG